MTGAGTLTAGGTRAAAGVPRLHLPDEPVRLRACWRDAVLGGVPLADVVAGDVAPWLWARWSALGTAGIDEARFVAMATAYRRELWLWLVGDRTWAQCCAGLVGRVARRVPC